MSDDLISRQAEIDALHDHFKDGFDGDKWWNSTHVLAVIEGLPPAQQWIPKKERLPEEGVYVLCQCVAGIVEVLKIDGGYWVPLDGEHRFMGMYVKAWMPIPKYKEEK